MSFKTSSNLMKTACRGFYTTCIRRCEATKRDGGSEKGAQLVLPLEPTHCCMSGCANCVWIKYAQELAQTFENGDVIAKQKITEKVQDPKLRAFLFTQLGLNQTDSKN